MGDGSLPSYNADLLTTKHVHTRTFSVYISHAVFVSLPNTQAQRCVCVCVFNWFTQLFKTNIFSQFIIHSKNKKIAFSRPTLFLFCFSFSLCYVTSYCRSILLMLQSKVRFEQNPEKIFRVSNIIFYLKSYI